MIQLTRNIKRSIAFFSDLHIGSPSAPWPEGMTAETEEGQRPLVPGEKQKILNSYLARAGMVLAEFQVDTIILLGDLVHGNNRKEGGRKTITPDLDLQVEACVKLLSPLSKSRSVYAVSGSGYHDSWDVRLDKRVVRALGGQYLGFLANVPLKGTKRIIQILHGVSSACIYREMIMARDGLFLDYAEGRKLIDFHVDLQVKGHWHYFAHLHHTGRHILQVPGWVDWSPWKGSLQYYGKMIPDIGFCVLLIDDRDRMSVYPFLFDRPKVADALCEQI